MADLKTAITEIVTGLGMCGADDLVSAFDARPATLCNVDPDTWQSAWCDALERWAT